MMDPETPVGRIVWACGSTGASENPHEVNVELCLACFHAAMDEAKRDAEGRYALAQGNLDQLRMTRDEEIARLVAERDEARRQRDVLVDGIRMLLEPYDERVIMHHDGCEETHWRCVLGRLLREVVR